MAQKERHFEERGGGRVTKEYQYTISQWTWNFRGHICAKAIIRQSLYHAVQICSTTYMFANDSRISVDLFEFGQDRI